MKKISKLIIILGIVLAIILPINKIQAHNVELDSKGYIILPWTIYGDNGTISISSSITSSYDLYYQYVDVSTSLYNQIKSKNTEATNYSNTERTKLNEESSTVESLKTEYQNILNNSSATEEQKQTAKEAYETAVTNYNAHVNTYNAKINEYKTSIKELKPSYIESNWTKTTDGKFNIDTSKYTGDYHFVLWAKLVVGGDTYYNEQLYTTQGTKEITITLDKATASIEKGKILKLTVTTNSSETVTWSSNKTDIATVSSDGTVTAKSKGVATITATVGEKSATCTVTVTENVQTDDKIETEDNNEQNNINNETSFEKARFKFEFSHYNGLKGYVENVEFDKNYNYYIYISKDKNANPKTSDEGAALIDTNNKANDKNLFGFNNDIARNILELSGKNYIYIIQKDIVSGNQEVVLKAKEMEKVALPALGNRLDIWLFDAKKTTVSNIIEISDNRKITYKIGKITSNDILRSFKNDSATKAFKNLLEYAKDSKYLKTGKITVKGLDYNITKDIKLEANTYYFVYMTVETDDGKYVELEDVAIYTSGSIVKENALYHFAFNEMEFDEDKANTSEDTTIIPDKNLPYTGKSIIIALSIIMIIGISYISYKKYKYLNIK